MASFYIPVTGLDADSTALNTIANDLSNMNTTAFKSQTTDFATLFYQEVASNGAGDEIQIGNGTLVAANETDFGQGSITSTGVATDAALDGNGFFVLNDDGSNLYTRSGGFTLTASGNLVSSDGLSVMGYPAVNGVVNPDAPLTAINIPEDEVQPPAATTSFGMTATLDSTSPIGTTVPAQVQVYDSLGQSYEATVTYTNTGTNQWSYSVSLPDALVANSSTASSVTTTNYNFGSSASTAATVDTGTNLTITGPTASGNTATTSAPTVTSGETVAAYAIALQAAVTAANITGVTVSSSGNTVSVVGTGFTTTGSVIQDPVTSANGAGSLIFNSDGNLISPATNVSGITFAGLADGASTLNMSWDLYGSNGSPTISQVDATSSVSATNQNGYGSGEYQSFAIGSDGTVTASFSNGQKVSVGQIALANVINLQGLQDLGNSEYATTRASGTAAIGVSGTDGLGTLEGGSIEQSNVNISAEFSDLIIAQRGFEANAKAVTTFDTITQETINMVH